jgi:hypothetical protein
MTELNLSLFTTARDLELAQYQILSGLQQARQAFSRTEVYPHLAQLIRLHQSLREVRARLDALDSAQRGELKGIDLEAGELVYEPPDHASPLLFDALSEWALPHLEEVIDEGRAIYEFVDEHTKIGAVGIVPAYQNEGYLLVPDIRKGSFCTLRYALSIFTSEDTRYRTLRTSLVEKLPLAVLAATPHELKRALAEAYPELPNPAAYLLQTDIQFPLEETILPVAKRKLIQYLALGGIHGAA